jgi:hypothetical protein
VSRCNNGNAQGRRAAGLLPFTVNDNASTEKQHVVGFCRRDFANSLQRFGDCFQVSASEVKLRAGVGHSSEERTGAVSKVLKTLRDEGSITGWRDELYPVSPSFGEEPLFLMERAAAPYFGLKAYGVHVVAYVEDDKGEKSMWVARRSKTKQTSPSKLGRIKQLRSIDRSTV